MVYTISIGLCLSGCQPTSVPAGLTKAGRRPAKAEYYAGTGTLLKTGVFDRFKDVAGHLLATRLTLADAIRPDKTSILDYGEITVRDLPDKYFDKGYMKTLD